MTRRDLIKRICGALAALPVVGKLWAEQAATIPLEDIQRVGRWLDTEWPYIVGVKETPWLMPLYVSVGGHKGYKVVRCCPAEGWADVFVMDGDRPIIDVPNQCVATTRVYGEVQVRHA